MIRAAAKLVSGGVAGKAIGLVREVLLAAAFGTSAAVGALRVAQTAVLIPVNVLGSDSLAAAFLPLFRRFSHDDAENARTLFFAVAATLLGLSVVGTLLVVWLAPGYVGLLAPGFDSAQKALTTQFLTIMALGIPFYLAGSLFAFLELGHGVYLFTASRAGVQSVGLIAGTLAAYRFGQPALLAWGFTAAHVVLAVWGLARTTTRTMLRSLASVAWDRASGVMLAFWRTLRPLLLLPVLLQGNLALERIVASLLGVTVVPALDYARFVTETGVVLLAVPLGVAGLAELSGLSQRESRERIERVLPGLLILAVPLSTFVALHADPIVRLLYQRGAFDAGSAAPTGSILFGLSLGFWAHVAGYVLLRTLSVQLRNADVLRISAIAVGLNVAVNLALHRVLGPVTLGIGASCYGLTLFSAGVHTLGVARAAFPPLLPLGLAVVPYAWLARALPQVGPPLAASLVVFVLYWGAVVAIVPGLREAVLPLVRRLRGRAT